MGDVLAYAFSLHLFCTAGVSLKDESGFSVRIVAKNPGVATITGMPRVAMAAIRQGALEWPFLVHCKCCVAIYILSRS